MKSDRFVWDDGDVDWLSDEQVAKFNPHHDERGRFSESDAAPGSGGDAGYNFSELEAETLRGYAYNSEAINDQLRSGLPRRVGSQIKQIDSAFKKVPPLPQDETYYRGLSPSAVAKLDKALKGDGTFIDKGFVSTTQDEEVAQSFAFERAGSHDAPQAWAEVAVPKGTRTIDMQEYSDTPGELEVLLNRGSRFKVLGVTRPEEGVAIYKMQVVPT